MPRKKSLAEQSDRTMMDGRPMRYDREILIEILMKLIRGEDIQKICAPPGMPLPPVVRGWIEHHQEARQIYRSACDLLDHRKLTRDLGLGPRWFTNSDWADQVRANCDRGWPADWQERKYIPPDWSKVYLSVGGPPVWPSENRQAYDDLINGFTELLEPRDLMELILTKEVTDATWEEAREAREKNALPERAYQQRLKALAQHQRPDAAEATRARSATMVDHSQGLLDRFKFHQGFDISQSRKQKRRAQALRQIERWRKVLGAKARRLSDDFIAEQSLAERYEVDQFLAAEERNGILLEAAETAPTPTDADNPAESASPLATAADAAETVEAEPSLGPAHEATEAAPPPTFAGDTAGAAGPVTAVDELEDATAPLVHMNEAAAAETVPPLAPPGEPTEPFPLTATKDAGQVPAPVPTVDELIKPFLPMVRVVYFSGVEPAPPVIPPGKAAEAAPLPMTEGQAAVSPAVEQPK
jgi:hypothetical protein